jgi:hypothetical protein
MLRVTAANDQDQGDEDTDQKVGPAENAGSTSSCSTERDRW